MVRSVLLLWLHHNVREDAKLRGRKCYFEERLATKVNAGGAAKKEDKVANFLGSKTA